MKQFLPETIAAQKEMYLLRRQGLTSPYERLKVE